MFADLWGCLALGPAFLGALSDLLQTAYDPAAQINLLGEYPPDLLRIWWSHQALSVLGFAQDEPKDENTSAVHNVLEVQNAQNIQDSQNIEAMWRDWQSLAGASPEPSFFDQAATIATAWLSEKFSVFGGKKLPDLLAFTAQDAKDAKDQAARALSNTVGAHSNVRVLWAAVQLAFATPATERLLTRILSACDDKPRAPRPAKDQQQRDLYVREIGRDII
jgi:hypothetical protein